jgi:predicted RNA-binding protein YlxR (DUF448 family)
VTKKISRKQKHIPLRTCVACKKRYDKRRLTRIVNSPQEGVIVDLTGKKNGRGAYLCDQSVCWDKAINGTNLLEQALKCEISPREFDALAQFKPVANEIME